MEDAEAATLGDWDALPSDLLRVIGELLGIPCRLFFRRVCRSWRAALPAMPAPWLLVFESKYYHRPEYAFVSLPTRSSIPWTPPKDSRCVGSSGGWLAYVDLDLVVTLLNPLTREQVRLPPLRREGRLYPLGTTDYTTRRNQFFMGRENGPTVYPPDLLRDRLIKKMAFSATAHSYAVALFCRFEQGMAFTKAGLDGWQWLDWPDAAGRDVRDPGINMDLDIVYHNGKLYYMTLCGRIWTVDPSAPPPVVPALLAKCRPPGPDHRRYGKHLVFTDDGTLHVVWSDGPGIPDVVRDRERRMLVQRYQPGSARHRRWRKVRHLAGHAFLIGNRNQSVAVPPSSASTWIRPNCIYLTDIMPASDDIDETEYLESEIWEFDVTTGDFRECDLDGFSDWLEWPKAIWFTPCMP